MAHCRLCGGDGDAPVTDVWVNMIHIEVPSINVQKYKHHGANRHRHGALRDKFVTFFKYWKREQGIPLIVIGGRPRVTFTRLIGKSAKGRQRTRYDKINWAAGCKPVLDALALAGILAGDTEDHVQDYYGQEASLDGIEGIRILIEVLG